MEEQRRALEQERAAAMEERERLLTSDAADKERIEELKRSLETERERASVLALSFYSNYLRYFESLLSFPIPRMVRLIGDRSVSAQRRRRCVWRVSASARRSPRRSTPSNARRPHSRAKRHCSASFRFAPLIAT